VREQSCNSGQWKRRDEREREKMGHVCEASEEKRGMSGTNTENGLRYLVLPLPSFSPPETATIKNISKP
jgi:hypothetical protein